MFTLAQILLFSGLLLLNEDDEKGGGELALCVLLLINS